MQEVCPICNGKQHIFVEGKGWVRCECWSKSRAFRVMCKSNFPIPLLTIEAETFIQNTPNRKQLGEAIKEEVSSYNKKPFFIFGTTLDKDKVAAIISRYLVIKHTEIETVRYIDINELTENKFTKEGLLDEDFVPFEQIDILVLSIGKEITNNAHRSVLYNLLYQRVLSEKFTIVLSAVPRSRILQLYQSQIDKFFAENFEFYEC